MTVEAVVLDNGVARLERQYRLSNGKFEFRDGTVDVSFFSQGAGAKRAVDRIGANSVRGRFCWEWMRDQSHDSGRIYSVG